MQKITLASASPRRRELLGRLLSEFSVMADDTPEIKIEGEDPKAMVQRLAMEKAVHIAEKVTDGLVIGAGMEDLGKGLRSMVGTMYGTRAKGTRYLEMTEGYVVKMALDKDNQVCGYQFLSLGKMMDAIKKGMSPNEAYEKNIGTYGRFKAEDGAVKWIDPRKE